MTGVDVTRVTNERRARVRKAALHTAFYTCRIFWGHLHVSLFNPTLLSQLYCRANLTPVRRKHHSTLKFRVVKNLVRIPGGMSLAALVNFAPLLWLADYLFGVSAMASAVKELPGKSIDQTLR